MNYFEILQAMMHMNPEVDFIGDQTSKKSSCGKVYVKDDARTNGSKNEGMYITFTDSDSNKRYHVIAVQGFKSELLQCLTVLHEVGHYRNNAPGMSSVEQEIEAWRWAFRWLAEHNYKITPEMETYVAKCLGTYLVQYKILDKIEVHPVIEFLGNFKRCVIPKHKNAAFDYKKESWRK